MTSITRDPARRSVASIIIRFRAGGVYAVESVNELMDQARAVIDGEMNCHTPEYRAVDLLHRAVELLARRHEGLSEAVGAIERACDAVPFSGKSG